MEKEILVFEKAKDEEEYRQNLTPERLEQILDAALLEVTAADSAELDCHRQKMNARIREIFEQEERRSLVTRR